jgi:hypothetical protein
MLTYGDIRWPCFLLAQLSNVCYAGRAGTHFTGFTGTKVQMLTAMPDAAVWFKKVFDESEIAHAQELHEVLRLLALLVQKCPRPGTNTARAAAGATRPSNTHTASVFLLLYQ